MSETRELSGEIMLRSSSMHVRHLNGNTIFMWAMGILSLFLILYLSSRLVVQFYTTPPLHRLQLEKDIPLPGAMPDANQNNTLSLLPGRSLRFDHFDFQTLDLKTHLLFIAHTGPNPDKEVLVDPKFNPETDSKTDGNVVVFDTLQQRVMKVLPIPQVAGVVAAPDLGRVYAADSNDGIIYAIDEHTFQTTPVKLDRYDSPDGMDYDAVDHKVFISDPGTPLNPAVSQDINLKNQNVAVIDTMTNTLITKIPLALDGKWGDDVGHTHYDPTSHLVYTVTLPLQDPNNPNIAPAPPSYLAVINPVTDRLVKRIRLPDECLTPHGFNIDSVQEIAFIACIDADPVPILVRVDLRTQKPIVEDYPTLSINPDIVTMDHTLHLLYVGCTAGVSIFQIQGRSLKKIGDFQFGASTHTIAVNDETHEIYLPLVSVGGRPTLRIETYNPNGVA